MQLQRAVSPHLLRRQEEFHKLAANHSELSGFGMLQLQAAIQLTAGLVEEKQPLHKSVQRENTQKYKQSM